MKRISLLITDELFVVLETLVTRTGRNELIESLLRENLRIENVRNEMGIEWRSRARVAPIPAISTTPIKQPKAKPLSANMLIFAGTEAFDEWLEKKEYVVFGELYKSLLRDAPPFETDWTEYLKSRKANLEATKKKAKRKAAEPALMPWETS